MTLDPPEDDMTRNMGKLDRALRTIVALGLLYLAFGTAMLGTGLWMWLAVVVAAVFLVTSLAGSCPLYTLIGLRTCRS
ncbi:DUF2892 domain-containing protein [Salipiger marinus]|uniref:YgaP family membrane protein n=2 Tax=Salipiger marinus TaxID=555512 RepID=UPI002B85B549|nr:DUF2892 domain-containing protein [Salipiger manganoxidans]MEB3421054.1 DUF2892 domain-containing protein [Salipiger manganoxidans]